MPRTEDSSHGHSEPPRARTRSGAGFTQIRTISTELLRQTLGALVDAEGGAPEGWPESLSRYLHQLVEWNERVNLVSRKSIDQVVKSQLLPSLAALRVVRPNQTARVLDVGSGGGFPGIPLAILRPLARVALVEATRKKCAFLEEVVRMRAPAGTSVHWTRIEAPTPELRAIAPFDLALARAVGRPEELGAAVRALLRPGGEFWAFTSPAHAGAVPWPSADDARTGLVRIALERPR